MRIIATILTIVAAFSSIQVHALPQNFDRRGSTGQGDSLASTTQRRLGRTTLHFERRALAGDYEGELEKRLGAFSALKRAYEAGELVDDDISHRHHHHRSLVEHEEHALSESHQDKAAFKADELVDDAIQHHKQHHRSVGELLEERSQVIELRDRLIEARLPVRSEVGLERRAVRNLVYSVTKRLGNHLDHLLEFKLRTPYERNAYFQVTKRLGNHLNHLLEFKLRGPYERNAYFQVAKRLGNHLDHLLEFKLRGPYERNAYFQVTKRLGNHLDHLMELKLRTPYERNAYFQVTKRLGIHLDHLLEFKLRSLDERNA